MTGQTSKSPMFSTAVMSIQERLGSRESYARMEANGGFATIINEDLAQFIAARDSFYLGTASRDGQPYIQHRGGPPGFLRVLDETTLAFGDIAGNRQYITVGNLSENDQAFFFLMDYPHRRRVKIWGKAHVVDNDDALIQAVKTDQPLERVVVFQVTAWDVNCPKNIRPRWTEDEANQQMRLLREQIQHLRTENQSLRQEVARGTASSQPI